MLQANYPDCCPVYDCEEGTEVVLYYHMICLMGFFSRGGGVKANILFSEAFFWSYFTFMLREVQKSPQIGSLKRAQNVRAAFINIQTFIMRHLTQIVLLFETKVLEATEMIRF